MRPGFLEALTLVAVVFTVALSLAWLFLAALELALFGRIA